MSKGLQWCIGICVMLITIALVFATVAPFFLPRAVVTISGTPPAVGQNQPPTFSFRGPGYMFGGPNRMFGGRGMMGIGGFGMPFMRGGFFLYLGLVVIIVGVVLLGAVWLSRRNRAPVAAAPAAFSAPAAAPAPAAAISCSHCGKPLQAEWKVCPYCGEKI